MISLNLLETLHFFDEVPEDSKKLATGMVAIAGEDLGAGLFKHYLQNDGKQQEVTIHQLPVTLGTRKGSRLDRWIETDTTLYQAEIKNWSSHALRGKPLSCDASVSDVQARAEWHWQDAWDPQNKKIGRAHV